MVEARFNSSIMAVWATRWEKRMLHAHAADFVVVRNALLFGGCQVNIVVAGACFHKQLHAAWKLLQQGCRHGQFFGDHYLGALDPLQQFFRGAAGIDSHRIRQHRKIQFSVKIHFFCVYHNHLRHSITTFFYCYFHYSMEPQGGPSPLGFGAVGPWLHKCTKPLPGMFCLTGVLAAID